MPLRVNTRSQAIIRVALELVVIERRRAFLVGNNVSFEPVLGMRLWNI